LLCDLWISCDVGLCTASILNLCCISLDRYFAITRPLKYSRQRSPKLAKIMIGVVWIGSFLITCPPIFGWRDTNRRPLTCTLNLLLSYRIYSSLGSFFLPCFIMVFVYLRIFKVIHDREKYLKKSAHSATTFSFPSKEKPKKEERHDTIKRLRRKSDMDMVRGYTLAKKSSNASMLNYRAKNSLAKLSTPSSLVGEKLAGTPSVRYKTSSVGSFKYQESRLRGANPEQMRLLKESKAAKTLAIVVGGFILSWLPFFVMYVLEAVLPTGTVTKALCDWITWLGYVNSAINPFIYAFCSKQFRSAFYRISFGSLKSTSQASSFKYQNNLYFLPNNFYKVNQSNFSNSNQSFPMIVSMGQKNRNSRIENF
ncbi:putative G- coupled receptor No18, partial [Brachionus plicatilis]